MALAEALPAPDAGNLAEDVPGQQLNADRRKYLITVPANGRRQVRVTYETRY